jgi:hypothetical protein
MSRTLLTSVNNVLNLVGERSITSTAAGILGSLTKQCLTQAISEVCQAAKWECLRERASSSTWTTCTATLSASVYQILGVYWYSSPTGTAEATFDYPTVSLDYVTPQEFDSFYLYPYSNTSNRPSVWTKDDYCKVKVNPYPTSSGERAKVIFDVFVFPPLPASDSTDWSTPDFFTDLLELKAAANLSMSHIQDSNMFQSLMMRYTSLFKDISRNNNQVGDTGYTMYRNQRTRNRGISYGRR